ncbi:MmgE/PrpD family protein [Halobacillus naozhouensis]|uniref:MmgE/PrpD family protein n=1 Tax=Halobacillus naozhouensis TaxID=554880 RepID=A0ABY8J442_9BACI|nr:MmgE/PrpD family protein [Halobacillus naozhouensis]WFT76831.1 MmgE/PrpD family protein [Halobacillus naozhouensis]
MVTNNLVEHILETTYEDIPDRVIEHGKKSLLNWLGVTIGAAQHKSIDILLEVSNSLGTSQQVSIFGRSIKTDLLTAVLVNGTASHVFDFDDTHLETIHHPSGPVAPVALALGEKFDLSTKEILRAFVLGCEAELRIANSVYPSHYRNGFHITSSTGVFGAAIAAGILLKLSKEKMAMALGLAGTQSFGLREMFGTMTKPFHAGKAAQNGLYAAMLVEKGFTSSSQVLEAKRGFANVYSTSHNLGRINERWGKVWEFENNTFKPFACGIVLHPSIDACIQFSEYASPDEVEEIRLRVHPYVHELTSKENPKTGLEGKFSIYHTGAIAFLEKGASENQFQDERVNAGEVVQFRKKIKPMADEQIDKDKVVATLVLKDGTTKKLVIDHAIGSLQNPLTTEMLASKFMNLSSPIIGEESSKQVIEKIMKLEKLDYIHPVIEAID